MLADDVRTGKVGGVCSVNMASVGSLHSSGTSERGEAGGGALVPGGPCELCGILALVLPPLPVLGIPSFAGTRVSRVSLPASPAESVPGLPFSRGPPAL